MRVAVHTRRAVRRRERASLSGRRALDVDRQLEHEHAPLAGDVLNADGSAVSIDGLFGDGQTESESTLTLIEAHERRERLFDLAGAPPAATVFDSDRRATVRDLDVHVDLAARLRVFHRVSHEVAERGADQS